MVGAVNVACARSGQYQLQVDTSVLYAVAESCAEASVLLCMWLVNAGRCGYNLLLKNINFQ